MCIQTEKEKIAQSSWNTCFMCLTSTISSGIRHNEGQKHKPNLSSYSGIHLVSTVPGELMCSHSSCGITCRAAECVSLMQRHTSVNVA